MNTPMIHWQQYNRPLVIRSQRPAMGLYSFMEKVTSYLASVLTAVGVVTGAAWLINDPTMILYLQVTTWTSGLVFMGVAIEAEKISNTWLAVATGIALPILAYLSQNEATELLLLAASMVAGWLAVGVFQACRTARR